MKNIHHLLVAGALAVASAAPVGAHQAADGGYTYTPIASLKSEKAPNYISSSLLLHPDGHLYGVSEYGGKRDKGTVFRMTTDGSEITVLHHFSGTDGETPVSAPLLLASDGALYGTTLLGGAHGGGTLFRIEPGRKLKTLHHFDDSWEGGDWPGGTLAEAADGRIYGATSSGGNLSCGTLYRVEPAGGVTVLYRMQRAQDGCEPAGLVDGGDGYLYGVNAYGGLKERGGAVFRISTEGVFELLHLLKPGSEGGVPLAPLMRASDGELYGVTSESGSGKHGTVFRVARNGTITVLTSFTAADGAPAPSGPLAEGSDGGLYLATQSGGANDDGAVIRVDKAGGHQVVHSLSGQRYGVEAGLTPGGSGVLYGATYAEDSKKSRWGSIYKLTLPPGH